MKNKLDQIIADARNTLASAVTLHDLANIKSHYIGKKSPLGDLLKQLGTLPKEDRPAFGQAVNQAKTQLAELIAQQEETIKNKLLQQDLLSSRVDFSMPGRRLNAGGLHPITTVRQQMEDIFLALGFEIALGPDVEDEFHNFDALNTPDDHPARNLSDTFYIEDNVLLRTQTSTVQIRVMESTTPPIKIISPGGCYRFDKFDASHSPNFSQVEGLYVDEGVDFAMLRDTLTDFTHKMFGHDIKTRFRPHFFPFTEPSAEMDVQCLACGGKGCPLCKHSGWLEICGAGMVDPNVFKAVGIDQERYTGFAFGMGIERITLLKYRVNDIRLLYENDVRFLRQFS